MRRGDPLSRTSAALAAMAVLAIGCAETARPGPHPVPRRWTITGATMGTAFNVTVVSGRGPAGTPAPPARVPPTATPPEQQLDQAAVEAEVRRVLDRIEGRMSHYRPDSEISRFNRAGTTEPQPMSRETLGVVAEALDVSRASEGAFDVTVGPLVDAWGFGPPGRAPEAPDEATLAALRAQVGADVLEVDLAASTLRKRRGEVVIDLSAIAKGYAVDAVASLLAGRGLGDYLVEIGGELRAGGRNEEGEPWRVAIERPAPGVPVAQRIVSLTNAALATSGDYRNFYDLGGARVSHIIDPRTGRPVTHGLRAVSVIADRCSLADARSTALNVLGPEEGYALAVAQGWAVLFVTDDGTGRLVERETPAFTAAVAGGAVAIDTAAGRAARWVQRWDSTMFGYLAANAAGIWVLIVIVLFGILATLWLSWIFRWGLRPDDLDVGVVRGPRRHPFEIRIPSLGGPRTPIRRGDSCGGTGRTTVEREPLNAARERWGCSC